MLLILLHFPFKGYETEKFVTGSELVYLKDTCPRDRYNQLLSNQNNPTEIAEFNRLSHLCWKVENRDRFEPIKISELESSGALIPLLSPLINLFWICAVVAVLTIVWIIIFQRLKNESTEIDED